MMKIIELCAADSMIMGAEGNGTELPGNHKDVTPVTTSHK